MADNLGDRMKAYEAAAESHLVRKLPVIIRIDGRAFHTVTAKLERPYSQDMMNTMARTLVRLCKEVSGCVYGYTQSDEMTLILQNDASVETQPWFDNRVQKIVSVVASMATLFFDEAAGTNEDRLGDLCDTLKDRLVGPAFFDARVFVVPSWAEAANALLWRQQDATKNAIQAAAQAALGKKLGRKTAQKLLHGKNGKEQQELLFSECGINFNDYPVAFKRGIACRKVPRVMERPYGSGTESVSYGVWEQDLEMPKLDWAVAMAVLGQFVRVESVRAF